MRRTLKADWYFIVPATFIWAVALMVTAQDFLRHRRNGDKLQLINLIGLGGAVAGVGIRLLARRTLGQQFSYALRTLDRHELVTHGIYRYVRHPAYTGDLLLHFGLTLALSSWRGLLVMLWLIPCFLYRIHIEERMLAEKFGERYRRYQQNSKRLLPLIY